MAIYSRPQANNDIVNGCAVVCVPAGSGLVYDPTALSTHIGVGENVKQFNRLNGAYLADEWRSEFDFNSATTADTKQSAASGNAVIYYPSGAGQRQAIYQLDYSCDSDSCSGVLTVESPSGTTIWGPIKLVDSFPGYFPFPNGLKGARDAELVVRLQPQLPSAARWTISVPDHRAE
jgi:hypothetical protein